MPELETSAFCFASDLADEGVDTMLANIQERAGLGGITPAFSYHAARDVFPQDTWTDTLHDYGEISLDVSKALTVKAHKFSGKSAEKIAAAGGSIETLPLVQAAREARA